LEEAGMAAAAARRGPLAIRPSLRRPGGKRSPTRRRPPRGLKWPEVHTVGPPAAATRPGGRRLRPPGRAATCPVAPAGAADPAWPRRDPGGSEPDPTTRAASRVAADAR